MDSNLPLGSRRGYDFNGIPKDAIFGRNPKFISVHRAYKAKFVQEFLRQLNKSYWDRSRLYGEDDLGNKWKALAPRTHQIKNDQADENPASNPQISGAYTSPRQLSPQQLADYQSQIGSSSMSVRNAAQRNALKYLGTPWYEGSKRGDPGTVKHDGREVPVTPKMIRTGRIVSATMPGPLVNHRHYGSPDLMVDVTGNNISISLEKIPYAEAADSPITVGSGSKAKTVHRPLIPENTEPWERIAHEAAMKEAIRVYNNIMGTKGK